MITTTMQTTSTEPIVIPMMRPSPVENKQFLYIYICTTAIVIYTIKSGNHVNKVSISASNMYT